MPTEFWGEAVSTAVFILNRSPTKALKGMMPYEAWHGRKPNVSYLRTFGCIGHVKTVKPGLGKLEDRSTKMVFLGYEDGTKAYQLYDPARGRWWCPGMSFSTRRRHGDGARPRQGKQRGPVVA